MNADEKNGADGNMQSMEFDLVFYPSIQLKSRSIRSKVAALSRFDCSFTLQFHISVVLHFIAKCTNSLMNCDPIWRLKQRFLLLQSKPLATIECEYQYSILNQHGYDIYSCILETFSTLPILNHWRTSRYTCEYFCEL